MSPFISVRERELRGSSRLSKVAATVFSFSQPLPPPGLLVRTLDLRKRFRGHVPACWSKLAMATPHNSLSGVRSAAKVGAGLAGRLPS